MPNHQPIAVVGMACVYPDARTPGELWENVLAQRRSFRRLPDERLRASDYLSDDPRAPDKTYSAQAAVIEGYEFDRVAFRVAGSVYRSADLAHWLALDVASRALDDAAYKNGDGLPRESTGVILGNTLTGEFSRASLMRLRWPYVRRVVESALAEEGWDAERRRDFIEPLEAEYKAPFAPVGEETLAGGLSNTIAGRICNQFDLKGGGYTVDGACSSSLLAVANACSSLASGDLDVALAGGVDLSLDPFEIVGFAKTGALAPDMMRIYDARSAGFWPGEGCGFVVLMRLEDAIAEGRRIYASICGWGISSDGSGGITRPEVDGQIQALRRAYRRAGYGIETVGYFEGHGTGTNVGDATELKVISRARREARADAPPAVIGSIKGNIGHTKAAAGVAGFLKAVLAVHTQTLPPITGCEKPHPELTGLKPALRVLREAEPWPADQPLRASASAMGFGGINAHVTLEGAASVRRKQLSRRERVLDASPQDAELFLFGARGGDELLKQVDRVLSIVARLSLSELGDLAAELAKTIDVLPCRAAAVASSPAELTNRLSALKSWILDGATDRLDISNGQFLGSAAKPPRIGFLFPGQGSPANVSGGVFRRRFDSARDIYNNARLPEGDSVATQVAQPAIAAASLAALRVLADWGIVATAAVGHSLGEISALHWAGVFDEQALLRIASVRGRAMADLGSPTGAMAAIGAPAQDVNAILAGVAISIVGFNSPRQTVVAGEAAAVVSVMSRAQERGWNAVKLPVSHAFHTSLVAAAAPVLAEQLARESMVAPQRRVISTVTGRELGSEDNISELLTRQVVSPVRFVEALTLLSSETDLLVETGPGQVLTGLARDTVSTPAVSVDACGGSIVGLLKAAGAAFALGAPVRPAKLFEGRFTRAFDLDWKPKFFVNPCELAPIIGETTDHSPRSRGEKRTNGAESKVLIEKESPDGRPPSSSESNGHKPKSAFELIRQLIADRAELPVAAVTEESRLLGDLHLNSITVGQLVGEAAAKLQLPPVIGLTDFANATVGKLAHALEELANAGGPVKETARIPEGVDTWVRPFTVDWIEVRLPDSFSLPRNGSGGQWRIIAPAGHPLEPSLRVAFQDAPGRGAVVCFPSEPSEADAALLLLGAQAVFAQGADARFVLVQQGWGAASFARTLHLESPGTPTRIVAAPFDHPEAARWVLREASSQSKYCEARYDRDGSRWEPRLSPLTFAARPGALPIGPGDVLLVTGGGKGIGAECALALARKTGAQLALLGRSAPSTDAELAANLERFAAAGIRCRYRAADVTSASAIRGAIAEVERDLGKITAFLHAAGANTPQLISSLDEAAFHRTFAPKLQGARNVLATIEPGQLRAFITFGSIIGRAGLAGEADYALANEWLTSLTEEFAAANPRCKCVAAEWSVWSGIGMGARLGRIESLRQQGITPISPERGVEILEQLLSHPLPKTAVVVTGRYGELPTLTMAETDLPLLRFLEHPKLAYPGVELIADSTLSTETDPYIDEHVYHGERLFPAVMGLEAMAQAAMALFGSAEPPGFENVKLTRPVVVPRGGKATIRVAALARGDGEVEVVLRCEETAFQTDHFRATCRFPVGVDRLLKSEPGSKIKAPMSESARVPLDVERDLYDDLLFHTGRFRRVKNYRLLRARECLAQIEPDIKTAWFGPYLPQDRVLGDTGVRDAAIHAIQACIPHAQLLPAGVERIVIGKLPCLAERFHGTDRAPELFLHARERRRDGDTFYYDVELLGEDGSSLERWENLCLKKVGDLNRKTPWPISLLGPYIERRLEELIPGSRVAVIVGQGISSDEAMRSACASETMTSLSIHRRSDGKPEIFGDSAEAVSASHSGDLTMAVAGPGPLGCDLEPVSARGQETWQTLLGSARFRLAGLIAQEAAEDLDAAATRVWTALECLKKAGYPAETPLVLGSVHKDSWILLKSGPVTAATYTTRVQDLPERLVLGVLASQSC